MYFSKRALRALPHPIHTGSGEAAKGLSHPAAVTHPCSTTTGPPRQPRFCRGDGANIGAAERICYFVHIFNQIDLDQRHSVIRRKGTP
jgi:hypothetical protein